MKNLFAILLVMVLTSCVTALEPPKSNTDYNNIIGNPIKIGNLEVAQYDFPEAMNWDDAKKACTNLGNGWRLPTIDELNILYVNQNKISGLANGNYYWYWSSTELDNFQGYALVKTFYVAGRGVQSNDDKGTSANVRAIRSF